MVWNTAAGQLALLSRQKSVPKPAEITPNIEEHCIEPQMPPPEQLFS